MIFSMILEILVDLMYRYKIILIKYNLDTDFFNN